MGCASWPQGSCAFCTVRLSRSGRESGLGRHTMTLALVSSQSRASKRFFKASRRVNIVRSASSSDIITVAAHTHRPQQCPPAKLPHYNFACITIYVFNRKVKCGPKHCSPNCKKVSKTHKPYHVATRLTRSGPNQMHRAACIDNRRQRRQRYRR